MTSYQLTQQELGSIDALQTAWNTFLQDESTSPLNKFESVSANAIPVRFEPSHDNFSRTDLAAKRYEGRVNGNNTKYQLRGGVWYLNDLQLLSVYDIVPTLWPLWLARCGGETPCSKIVFDEIADNFAGLNTRVDGRKLHKLFKQKWIELYPNQPKLKRRNQAQPGQVPKKTRIQRQPSLHHAATALP